MVLKPFLVKFKDGICVSIESYASPALANAELEKVVSAPDAAHTAIVVYASDVNSLQKNNPSYRIGMKVLAERDDDF